MNPTFIFLHSLFRWLVLASLLVAIGRALAGLRTGKTFSQTDNFIRHSTATIAHLQLVLGIYIYTQSPVVKFFFTGSTGYNDSVFFALIHISLMLAAIIMITIGSATAKRTETDKDKFSTMLFWFLLAFIIIIIAIPWPFSPLAKRPYLSILN